MDANQTNPQAAPAVEPPLESTQYWIQNVDLKSYLAVHPVQNGATVAWNAALKQANMVVSASVHELVHKLTRSAWQWYYERQDTTGTKFTLKNAQGDGFMGALLDGCMCVRACTCPLVCSRFTQLLQTGLRLHDATASA